MLSHFEPFRYNSTVTLKQENILYLNVLAKKTWTFNRGLPNSVDPQLHFSFTLIFFDFSIMSYLFFLLSPVVLHINYLFNYLLQRNWQST